MNFQRRLLTVLVLAVVLLGAAPGARADSSLFGAVTFPTGSLADATTAGWSFGGFATGQVASRVDLGALVSYTDFVVDPVVGGVGAQFGPTLSAWEIEALVQVAGPGFKGFLGLGLANYPGIGDLGDPERKNGFAWQLGVAYQIAPFEGRLAFHQIDTAGGTANWIAVSAGILF